MNLTLDQDCLLVREPLKALSHGSEPWVLWLLPTLVQECHVADLSPASSLFASAVGQGSPGLALAAFGPVGWDGSTTPALDHASGRHWSPLRGRVPGDAWVPGDA